MSIHEVKVVRIDSIEPHENADKLELVKIWEYTCVVGKGEFKVGDLAAYIEPDYVVDTSRKQFMFLAKKTETDGLVITSYGKQRITVKRLRGVWSSGLLIKAPEGSQEGDNVMEILGITRWEPEETDLVKGSNTGGSLGSAHATKGPSFFVPHYDLHNLRKYAKLIKEDEEVLVTAKIHGCFQGTARIKTPTGYKKIKNIEVGDLVLGYNHKTNKIESTNVLNVFRNGKTKNWIKLKCERVRNTTAPTAGNGFISFKLTENHKIWSVTKNDYVQIKDCKIGDLVKQTAFDTNLTSLQRQILIGKMFGDGSLCKHNARSAYVSFSHNIKDSEYLEYCEEILKPIIGTTRELISGFGSEMISKKTKSMRKINDLFCSWIKNETKQIPEEVIDLVTPITLAFWYMDDGSLGHSEFQKDRALIATCGFSDESCQVLQKCLEKFGINSIIYKSKNKNNEKTHNRIRLNTEDAYKFFNLIGKYIHPSMRRKLPEELRNVPFEKLVDNEINEHKLETFDVKIQAIENVIENNNTEKFDIETELHNYFAHDILVHNCNARYVYHDGEMFCGSRNTWKKEPGYYFRKKPKNKFAAFLLTLSMFISGNNPEKVSNFFLKLPFKWMRRFNSLFVYFVGPNAWWKAYEQNTWIRDFCIRNPGTVLYGEVYGPGIQGPNYHYGLKDNQIGFAVFDILENGSWIDNREIMFGQRFYSIKTVPVLYQGLFNLDNIATMAELKETFNNAGHIREGVVVKPIVERDHERMGRVRLKYVSNQYLGKS